MNPLYELHINAATISANIVKEVEDLGFAKAQFINPQRCEVCEYVATLHDKKMPNDRLWESTKSILESDSEFRGTFVEERIDPENLKKVKCTDGSNPSLLPQIPLSDVEPGSFSACDLHISVVLADCSEHVVEHLEALKLATIEKAMNYGMRRIYTVTLETQDDGKALFNVFLNHFSEVAGFEGKIVLEYTKRHFRQPNDAPTLPIAMSKDLVSWFANAAKE